MAELDRADLLAALAKLDAADDSIVAEAGRSAASLLSDSGLDWSDIIVPQDTLTALAADDAAKEPAAPAATDIGTAQTTEEALVLIDRLLDRKTLFEGTRDDLLACKHDIAAGEFDASDLAYLNALYARVMAGGGEGGD